MWLHWLLLLLLRISIVQQIPDDRLDFGKERVQSSREHCMESKAWRPVSHDASWPLLVEPQVSPADEEGDDALKKRLEHGEEPKEERHAEHYQGKHVQRELYSPKEALLFVWVELLEPNGKPHEDRGKAAEVVLVFYHLRGEAHEDKDKSADEV